MYNSTFKRQHYSNISGTIKDLRGFTLIELVVVLAIMAILAGFLTIKSGSFAYWEQEQMIRKLSETINFLYNRAVIDNVFYRLEFDMDPNGASYKVGQMVTVTQDNSHLASFASSGAIFQQLSAKLADRLNSSIGSDQLLITPENFPSLGEPVKLPAGCVFEDIVTMGGTFTENPGDGTKPGILFSPRGFSEFAVIHLLLSEGAQVTILVNPFTGITSIYREYKEFEWTYGRKNDDTKK